MTIDIGFIEGGELDKPEQFLSVGRFYNLAQVLGIVVEHAHNIDNEQMKEWMAPFIEYVGQDRMHSEEQFAKYCAFTTSVAAALQTRDDVEISEVELDTLRAEPGDFHEDVRAFLGRLILSGEATAPEQADQITSFVGVSCALIAAMKKNEADKPDVIEALDAAFEDMGKLGGYCEASVENKRPFGFSP